MISFEEFCAAVQEKLSDYMPEKYREANVELHKRTRDNGEIETAVALRRTGHMITPLIYLRPYYQKGMREEQLDSAFRALAQDYVRSIEEIPKSEIPDVASFASVKKYVSYTLMNLNANEDRLGQMPHKPMYDMAVVYELDLTEVEALQGRLLVDNAIMKIWDVSVKELEQAAKENMRSFKPMLQPMGTILLECMTGQTTDLNLLEEGEAVPDEVMYVLSRKGVNWGAKVMLLPEVMEQVRNVLKEDFYVIPSSVHEVIVVRKSCGLQPKEIRQMLIEVNEQIGWEDTLSRQVFEYHDQEKALKPIARFSRNRGDEVR